MKKTLFIFAIMLMPLLTFSQEHKQNASKIIEEIINEQGIEDAQKKFAVILADTNQFALRESEFNKLGYRLLRERKYEEALAVFQMNVKAFPGSWNVWDSMGEMYYWTGNNEQAIKHFEKSLELNPDNENAKRNLNQILGTIADHENETKTKFQYRFGVSTGINEPYFGEEPPDLIPKLFAPGIISIHGHFEFACTFSPDGREFYFTRRSDDRGNNVIMVCKWESGGWTAPDTAAFAWPGDHEPHISPDGNKLYFGTTRMKPGGDRPAYGIWVMSKRGTGWSPPEYATDGMYASATLEGSVYVTDIDGLTEGGVIKLVMQDGVFKEPVRLGGGVNHPVDGIHPYISPREDYLLFDCHRDEGFGGEGDIYVAFRDKSGTWGDAFNLGAEVNGPGVEFCASVSPDGKYIFYTKNRDIYWVSSEILKTIQ
jgi:hypothetical protein